MTILEYIDKYGVYSFDEVSFTEVDNVIFSSLSYIDFESIVSPNRYSPKRLFDAYYEYKKIHSSDSKNILAIRQAIKIFSKIYCTRRYRNLLLYNYIYDNGSDRQFSAITIEISPKLVYVSFEGTDQMISGWKEDFMMSYTFPVMSQKKAIDYINKRFLFRRKKIILGGHSKGGNLALVASMYANFLVKDKIINIYNNDGPGLLEEQFNSSQYKSIKSKLINIVPDYSVFGLLFNNNDYVVIRSLKKGILAHDLMNWEVCDKNFCKSKLSNYSKTIQKSFSEWINQYEIDERKKIVDGLFILFEEANINSLLDIKENKLIILKLINEMKNIDDDLKKVLHDFFKLIFNIFKDATKEELLSFIKK